MNRKVMAVALRGTKRKGGKVKTSGICALAGLRLFTPHDLRRTTATLAGDRLRRCVDREVSRSCHEQERGSGRRAFRHGPGL
jgi:integrase